MLKECVLSTKMVEFKVNSLTTSAYSTRRCSYAFIYCLHTYTFCIDFHSYCPATLTKFRNKHISEAFMEFRIVFSLAMSHIRVEVYAVHAFSPLATYFVMSMKFLKVRWA